MSVPLLLLAVLAEPARASVHVDTARLGEAGVFLAARVRDEAAAVLREHEVLDARSAHDPTILVRIEPMSDVVGFRFRYEVRRGGVRVEGAHGSAECRLCTHHELSEQVGEAIVRLVPRVRPLASSLSVPPLAPPLVGADAHNGEGDTSRWIAGRKGGWGIALSSVGAFALGLGVGLAVAEPFAGDAPAGARAGASVVQVSGLGTAVVGATVLGSGLALILVERARRVRTRR